MVAAKKINASKANYELDQKLVRENETIDIKTWGEDYKFTRTTTSNLPRQLDQELVKWNKKIPAAFILQGFGIEATKNPNELVEEMAKFAKFYEEKTSWTQQK